MKRVLVTGGAGAIGGNLVSALVREGSRVVVLDNLTSGHTENLPAGIRFIKGDVGDEKPVARSRKTCGPRVYPIGTGRKTSIKTLAALVQDACGREVEVRFTPRRGWNKTLRRRADIRPTRRDAGWSPRVGLEDGLRRTVAWYRGRFGS